MFGLFLRIYKDEVVTRRKMSREYPSEFKIRSKSSHCSNLLKVSMCLNRGIQVEKMMEHAGLVLLVILSRFTLE